MRRLLAWLTPTGRWFLVLGIGCYVLDSVGEWPVFQLMWVSLVVGAILSGVVAVLPVRPECDLAVDPPRTVVGDTAEVRLRARRRRRQLPSPGPIVELSAGADRHVLRLPMLRRESEVGSTLTLTARRRGVIRVGPVLGLRQDPLALVRWTETWSDQTELLVLPRMVPVGPLVGGAVRDQEGVPSDEISMSDLAFHALREYVPGDELRHVHWRSSAKAARLQIRQYHDTRRSHLTLVVDPAATSYADPEDFETAVSAAASVAARADLDRVDLSLLCGSHAVVDRGLDAILDVCCRIELGDAPSLVSAGQQALRLAPETSWLVLVTGGATAPEALSAVRREVPADVSVLAIAADAGVETAVDALAPGLRLLRLRRLAELPRALEAATPRVLT